MDHEEDWYIELCFYVVYLVAILQYSADEVLDHDHAIHHIHGSWEFSHIAIEIFCTTGPIDLMSSAGAVVSFTRASLFTEWYARDGMFFSVST